MSDLFVSAPWSLPAKKVLEALNSQPSGLSEENVALRKQTIGKNELPRRRPDTAINVFLRQLWNPLLIILVVSGAVTIALQEWIETAVILLAILTNASLGFWQEWKAQHVIERLEAYLKTKTRVRRASHELEIDASDLVPGDVILLSQGDRIPADARILTVQNLMVDESVLTGESQPIEKNDPVLKKETSPADQKNMLHGGTLVLEGIGEAVITATGKDTQFGSIAELSLSRREAPTPLQLEVARLSRFIGIGVLLAVISLFGLGLATGRHWLEMLLLSVAVGVSTVPEGMPIALTVILAIGVERLAARQGVVRRLLAAEALGSTTLILTDKTGTLTQAKMSLEEIRPENMEERELLSAAVLTSQVAIENPEDDAAAWKIIGRPMEAALVKGAANHFVLLPDVLKQHSIVQRIPFDSSYKFSGVVTEKDGKRQAILVGAPDILTAFIDWPEAKRTELEAKIANRAEEGVRLLGVVTMDLSHDQTLPNPRTLSGGFQFAGLLGFRDPLRPGVIEAIHDIARSGVRTRIVTGDHPGTAAAIAREIGLITREERAVHGNDIDTLDETKLRMTRVFARVTPAQKLQLVERFKKMGEIVAVTGDGVNDAPALRVADIGVAMGSGTDVSKDAADLVILDDNYSTIVSAIEEGRRIVANIRKAVTYGLTNSFGIFVLVTGSFIANLALPVNAIQILFINFFTDSLPAVAYAFEHKQEENRQSHGVVLSKQSQLIVLVGGLGASAVLFLTHLLFLGLTNNAMIARTATYMSLSISTLLMALAIRSFKEPLWLLNPLENPPMLIGVSAGILLTLFSIYLPIGNQALDTIPLNIQWLLISLLTSFLTIVPLEIAKKLFRR